MTREAPSIGEPPDDLRRFPVWHVLKGTSFFRVTSGEHGPWWFANAGDGRFDLDPPRGTCYLADDPVVAVLEFLGAAASAPVLDPAILDDRAVWSVQLPEQCDAADVTVRRARGFGVTAELASVTPYAVARRWAAAFAAAGFGGIRYRARHDPAGGRCLALFGVAGERRRWRRGRRGSIDESLRERLRVEAGIVVAAGPPSERQLDVRDVV